MPLDLIRRIAPYLLAVASVAAFLFGAYHHGVTVTKDHYLAIIAKANEQHADEVALIQAKVREQEQKHAEQIATIDDEHTKAIENEKIKLDEALAAVATGTIRLRDKFTCQHAASKPNVSNTSASASISDAAATSGLQRPDVEFLVRFASRADDVANQLSACQAVIKSDRAK